MTFNKMESAGYLVNHTARLFEITLREQIASLGIAPAQFMALLELWRQDGLTQKDLAEQLDVEQATMANTIARMERDGLIERHPHPEDGRSRSIHLTDKARSIESEATRVAAGINRDFLSCLSAEDSQKFIQIMQKIVLSNRQKRNKAGDG